MLREERTRGGHAGAQAAAWVPRPPHGCLGRGGTSTTPTSSPWSPPGFARSAAVRLQPQPSPVSSPCPSPSPPLPFPSIPPFLSPHSLSVALPLHLPFLSPHSLSVALPLHPPFLSPPRFHSFPKPSPAPPPFLLRAPPPLLCCLVGLPCSPLPRYPLHSILSCFARTSGHCALHSFAVAPCVPVSTAASCDRYTSRQPSGENAGHVALPWCGLCGSGQAQEGVDGVDEERAMPWCGLCGSGQAQEGVNGVDEERALPWCAGRHRRVWMVWMRKGRCWGAVCVAAGRHRKVWMVWMRKGHCCGAVCAAAGRHRRVWMVWMRKGRCRGAVCAAAGRLRRVWMVWMRKGRCRGAVFAAAGRHRRVWIVWMRKGRCCGARVRAPARLQLHASCMFVRSCMHACVHALCVRVCVHTCVCVRACNRVACARANVRACIHACLRMCVQMCVRAYARVSGRGHGCVFGAACPSCTVCKAMGRSQSFLLREPGLMEVVGMAWAVWHCRGAANTESKLTTRDG
eukprot:365577-Chlamydomonas_euryale.AAC.4